MKWSLSATSLTFLSGAVLCLIAATLGWTIWVRSGRRRSVALLEGLRFFLITLLVFTLMKPEFSREVEQAETPVTVILTDHTASMTTRDVRSGTNVLTRNEWLARQETNAFWAPLESDARVLIEPFGDAASAGEDEDSPGGTDLSRALANPLEGHRNLKAVLLVSDGDWNRGASPLGTAARYRAREIPIFATAVGSESPLPDLAVTEVQAPSYGLLGEQIAISFRVRNRFGRPVSTKVSLSTPAGVEAEREVYLPALEERQETLLWMPKEEAMTELTLTAAPIEGESFGDNNRKDFQIEIRSEQLHVLVVDSRPRWEYRYLRNALERDPGVTMQCLLFLPALGMGGGAHYLPAFPGRPEEMSRYDVVFLGDVGVGEGELTREDAEAIRALVEYQAGGLVFLPGSRGRQYTFAGTALQEMMPVRLDPENRHGLSLQNETPLLLTREGRGHWLTRFESNPEANQELWRHLPGYFWSAAVEKNLPGTEVLAVHGSYRNQWGRLPMLVTRDFGAGKVLFLGTDSAWRWRRGVEDKYHYRFWSQVVRWMSHRRHLAQQERIKLLYTPESPAVGDSVFLQAMATDAAGFPLEEKVLVGTMAGPKKTAERIEFDAVSGGWGVFHARWSPPRAGNFHLAFRLPDTQRATEMEITVARPTIEKVGQPTNPRILQDLARRTGGAWGGTESLDTLIRQMAQLPEPKPVVRTYRLWCHPVWGGFLLALLAVYWSGRKLAGLV